MTLVTICHKEGNRNNGFKFFDRSMDFGQSSWVFEHLSSRQMVKNRISNTESRRRKVTGATMEAVKRHRKLSYKEMAANLQVDISTLYHYRKGQRSLPGEQRSLFMKHYRFDPEQPFAKQKRQMSGEKDAIASEDDDSLVKQDDTTVAVLMPEITEPFISEDHPNAFRCRACGTIEDMSRPYCRCGAYLGGQVTSTAHEVTPEFVRDLGAAVKRTSWKSFRWTMAGMVPLALVMISVQTDVFRPVSADHFASFWGPGLVFLLFSLAQGAKLSRQEKALRKKQSQKRIEDIIASTIFRCAALATIHDR